MRNLNIICVEEDYVAWSAVLHKDRKGVGFMTRGRDRSRRRGQPGGAHEACMQAARGDEPFFIELETREAKTGIDEERCVRHRLACLGGANIYKMG